ncbi:MAG: replication initiator protein A [Terracidiphilus sp.]
MVSETPNPDGQLLQAKHGKGDLFICDVADAVLKDLVPQMEHPFYSLSKKPDTQIRRYEHNGNWLEIVPSVKGLATIYDKDILIYCISQLMGKLNRNEPVGPRVHITSYDLLRFTNRGTAGKDYDALCEAIDRLAGTRITTNIRTGEEEQRDSFGLIDAASIRRKHGLDGRLQWVEIKLSDWVFNAIKGQEVLTLHPDYFRLGKPLERRVYELARKHCGRQSTWTISVETLLKKSGSQSIITRFRQMVKHIAAHDHLPDYRVSFDEESDNVTFFNRDNKWVERPLPSDDNTLPPLPDEAYEEGRNAAPGYDIHALENDWRDFWESSGKPKIDNPAAAFVGFCRSRHNRAPIQRKAAGYDD